MVEPHPSSFTKSYSSIPVNEISSLFTVTGPTLAPSSDRPNNLKRFPGTTSRVSTVHLPDFLKETTSTFETPVFVARSHEISRLSEHLASAISGWIVKRDIDRIDLVSTLKTRD